MPMIGRYVVPSKALSGGHAQLYKAVDVEDPDKVVALKLFNPPHAVDSRVLRAAWTNELETYQRLGEHPYLARLLDWGTTDESAPYLVFEWLQGDLAQHIANSPLEGWDDFWPIARDLLSGLSLIHSAGFVHRDVKPENVLLGNDGTFKVADFGTTRLAEAMSIGLTMARLGTTPYAPPEWGTPGPTPAYDVYSFAVLAVVCLAGEVPEESRVHEALNELDLPNEIREALAPCLKVEVNDRPESAGVLLASLRQLQEERERRSVPTLDLFVLLERAAVEAAQRALHLPADQVPGVLLEDLQAVGAFAYDQRPGAPHSLQAMGQTLLYKLEPDDRCNGVLRVKYVLRPPLGLLEDARAEWHRPAVRFRTTSPTNPVDSWQRLQVLLLEVTEHDAKRAEKQGEARSSGAFTIWRRALEAKFKVEDERAAAIKFHSWTRQGGRVRFRVGDLPDITVGENRLVSRGKRRVLFGEVEGVENSELILFVTRGNLDELPRSGVLEFDAEASKSKLRREHAALARLSTGRTVRPRLREVLLGPAASAIPVPVPVGSFFQSFLDEAKQHAVQAALGSTDFLLVQGPPGTGKTTFIAELVAQELQRNLHSRILVTAQTHIAVDNALASITNLCPTASIVRLGRVDQIAEEIGGLSLSAQLDQARENVLTAGREFLRAYAEGLGLELGAADLEGGASDLKVKHERLTQLRSRLSLKRAERKELNSQIAEHDELAPEILDAAESIERAAAAGTSSELAEAGRGFIDLGLRLAASLETGGRLGTKLVEVEGVIEELAAQLSTAQTAEADLRESLAAALGLDSKTAPEALLAAIKERQTLVDDKVYNQLQVIAADWADRFGRGREFSAVVIAGADVVSATCVGLTGVRGVEGIDFDLCIVDEASKATATETIVPLVQSRRWVLVGDDRQLPPFVEGLLTRREFLERFELTADEVAQTLFSVLADGLPEDCVVSLTHQHRMHPGIGELISECFYDSTLTSDDRELAAPIAVALGDPVTWVDTSGRDDRRELQSGTSYLNPCEVRQVQNLLERLHLSASRSGARLSVALLTGYEAQRRELVDMFNRHESEFGQLEIHIANVDAYQGQEADVAVFCTTRSNEEGELGFLRQEQRVNVALSRARDALVIVGDASFVRGAKGDTNPLAVVLKYIESSPQTCRVRREV